MNYGAIINSEVFYVIKSFASEQRVALPISERSKDQISREAFGSSDAVAREKDATSLDLNRGAERQECWLGRILVVGPRPAPAQQENAHEGDGS